MKTNDDDDNNNNHMHTQLVCGESKQSTKNSNDSIHLNEKNQMVVYNTPL